MRRDAVAVVDTWVGGAWWSERCSVAYTLHVVSASREPSPCSHPGPPAERCAPVLGVIQHGNGSLTVTVAL